MRISTSRLFTFAFFTLGFIISALAHPIAPENHTNYDKVSFSKGATAHLRDMGFTRDARKVVEDYHKNTVAAELDKHGAKWATITSLAHTEGSADPRMHITTVLLDAHKKTIESKYGTPEKTGKKHHIYTDQAQHPLPKEYTQVVGQRRAQAQAIKRHGQGRGKRGGKRRKLTKEKAAKDLIEEKRLGSTT